MSWKEIIFLSIIIRILIHKINDKTTEQPKVNLKENSEKQELSIWQRIVRWFKSIFSSKSSEKTDRSNELSDKQYLENLTEFHFSTNRNTAIL
jgi:nitric oxide reductase large subunit